MTTITIKMDELKKVVDFLFDHGLQFELRPCFEGYILAVPSYSDRDFDLVCHNSSYGHQEGLLESMGVICENDFDSVEGWLTGEDAIERIKKYYLKEGVSDVCP